MCPCVVAYTTLSFTTGVQIQAIFPPKKSKQLYKGAPSSATASAYLCKYGACKKYKFHMTVVCHGEVKSSEIKSSVTVNKIECKYQTKSSWVAPK